MNNYGTTGINSLTCQSRQSRQSRQTAPHNIQGYKRQMALGPEKIWRSKIMCAKLISRARRLCEAHITSQRPTGRGPGLKFNPSFSALYAVLLYFC